MRASIHVPGGYDIKDTDDQPRTNWRQGLLHKAATTRDGCVAHMLLFDLSRRARHLPNSKTAAFLQCRPDGTTKKNLVFRKPPDRGGILKSSKKQAKNHAFFNSYVPGISCERTCTNPTPPTINSLMFILTWGGVWCRFLVLSSTPA